MGSTVVARRVATCSDAALSAPHASESHRDDCGVEASPADASCEMGSGEVVDDAPVSMFEMLVLGCVVPELAGSCCRGRSSDRAVSVGGRPQPLRRHRCAGRGGLAGCRGPRLRRLAGSTCGLVCCACERCCYAGAGAGGAAPDRSARDPLTADRTVNAGWR
ncbi:hypothetical protein T492DRAFT_1052050 [Pavlovales sp. CCMP2436]|nr:hypothetical protein T492DRAFT_1052050 [Pavlovales sp. CCMP2436]